MFAHVVIHDFIIKWDLESDDVSRILTMQHRGH